MKNKQRILFTGFNGQNNSSKILLDKIKGSKIYLKNSFSTSVSALEKELLTGKYDLVIATGQAPLDVDTIRIETRGIKEQSYITKYDYTDLKSILEQCYNVEISSDAGNYLCNNLYYHGLKFIEDKELKIQMIFIHIPQIENITDINKLATLFDNINYCSH